MDVVVCVKNRAHLLNRILRQIVSEIPFKNLIVVYGTSIDDTKEIAERYADKVFWDRDRGLGAARNLGVKKATSEIVAMIDSDVILTKGWCKKVIRHFKDPKVAAAMGTCIYGYGCKPLERLWEYNRWEAREHWGCNNTMFKRDIILQVGNFNQTIEGAGEDYDMYRRLLDAGYKWVWDRGVVVYHPMNMLEFLIHVRWWAQGLSSLRENAPGSPLRLCRDLFFSILKAFGVGMRFFRIHPILSFYVPLLRTTSLMTEFKVEIRRRKKNQRGLHS